MFERRVLARVPLDADVSLRRKPDDVPAFGTVKNISASGILIQTHNSFEAGEILQAEVISSEDRRSGIRRHLRATVRVVRLVGDAEPYDLAVEMISYELP